MISCWSISFKKASRGPPIVDLAEAFLKQYRYNEELAPNRTQLQRIIKRDTKTFKEYGQWWREVAAHVQPPLSEKEMVTMYIDTL
ncbi:hypothetical protein CR513_45013, partial [Mucuna pruriens]